MLTKIHVQNCESAKIRFARNSVCLRLSLTISCNFSTWHQHFAEQGDSTFITTSKPLKERIFRQVSIDDFFLFIILESKRIK